MSLIDIAKKCLYSSSVGKKNRINTLFLVVSFSLVFFEEFVFSKDTFSTMTPKIHREENSASKFNINIGYFEDKTKIIETNTSQNYLGLKKEEREGFYSLVSYSLLSPSFDNEKLKSLNQESLGLSVSVGYLLRPNSGWGVAAGLGVFHNSKTDRSLPDFVALRPYAQLLFTLNSLVYFGAGLFTYRWQDEKFKKFTSYLGQEYLVGLSINKFLNIRFGFTYIKINGEFILDSQIHNSLVSIRGVESQVVYIF